MIIEAEYEEVEDCAAAAESELDLSDDDSLPWLEADEDDNSAGGIDTAQVIGFLLILLTILIGVVGAIWYFSNRGTDADMIADGSIIEAPEGPIKERPTDPGGKEFAGTGNVAPVVAEGGTREGVMETSGPGGEAAGGTGDTAAATKTQEVSAGAGGVGVQLAAYSSRARAEQGWNDLRRRTDVLDNARYRVEEGTVDIGTVYRLQAVAGSRVEADQLCAALKADGLDCQVKP